MAAMVSESDTPQRRGNRRSLSDRLQLAAVRLSAQLPDRVKIALSGEPAIVISTASNWILRRSFSAASAAGA